MEQVRTTFTFLAKASKGRDYEYIPWLADKEIPFYYFLGKVDQESLRGFLKELSSEPHIAAGRRDK